MSFVLTAQRQNPETVFGAIPPSTLIEKTEAVAKKKLLQENSIFKNYPIRSIGPTIMGGRVVDIAVNESNVNEFYVAYASGGIFKTTNNGQSFTPIFDYQARLTVGDIALSPQNPNLLWVGTGENNSSRSSYAGFGVYKSLDAGNTWQHCGLEDTQHIGRIVAHPTDEKIAWVASIGALYSKNEERGVYKTVDGGKSWQKTLFINDSTGVIDLLVNPKNPQQLWATAWERHRTAWHFKGQGKGSGLYYSEDGGEKWQKITTGLPDNQYLGRMGIALCEQKPNVMYLVLDNQTSQKEVEKKDSEKPKNEGNVTFELLKVMSDKEFDSLDDKDLDKFLEVNNFPKKYTSKKIKSDINNGIYTRNSLINYFENDNDKLFNTPIIGAELYRSDDFGKSWFKTHQKPLEGLFYTYGYYFGQIAVAPTNAEVVYLAGVPLLKSENGGKSFKTITPRLDKVHADQHSIWINPKNPAHLLLGNDGGIFQSYDTGAHYTHLNNVSVGQFYTVAYDMETPYNIYGGLQDNGVYFGSSKSMPNDTPDWEMISGGDGMGVQVNPQNNKIIYTGYQFGNYMRFEYGKYKNITPENTLGTNPLRFNWRTPFLMSKHNSDILYIAGQHVKRSLDRGNSWENVSDLSDFTQNLKGGNIPFSTISALAESPLKFGKLYIGTDDGQVYILNGNIPSNITQNLPIQNRWISSVFASPHSEKIVFVTLTGYRFDDCKAYIYYSSDDGKTWKSLVGNLPNEAVNVLIQDTQNPDLLYIGTDEGAYISFDFGKQWHCVTGNFPNVAVYDLALHPREQELVLATHGRGIYVLDIKPLQQMTASKTQEILTVFAPSAIAYSASWGKARFEYLPIQEPKLAVLYYNNTSQKNWEVQVKDEKGTILTKLEAPGEKGFQVFTWNLNIKPKYLSKGKYTLTFAGKDTQKTVNLEVKNLD